VNASNFIYIAENKAAEKAAQHLSEFSRLGFDTETTGVDLIGGRSKLLLLQLGTEEQAYVFDARRINTDILKPILESKDILKILHNAKFDYQSTKLNTGITLHCLFDTMLAYRLLTSGKETVIGAREKGKKKFPYKSLNHLCNTYLGMNLDKEIRKTFYDFQYNREFSESQLKYAAEDILVLHPLFQLLSDQLIEQNLEKVALMEFSFIGPAAEMELAGVCIDKDKWREVIASAEAKADEYRTQVNEILSSVSEQNTLFGASTVNIESNDQLIESFRKLGVTLESTDQKVLKQCKHPAAKLLMDYRSYKKLISTYGESLLRKINKTTGRLHYTLQQLGTDTGRLSSENPNIQNIPQDRENDEIKISFRECFVAAPGKVILTADYSQCELRILAQVSKDPGFLSIFENNQDLHEITAQESFGFTLEELKIYQVVKKLDGQGRIAEASAEHARIFRMVSDYRQRTKAINFGIAYGISAFSLAERFKITKEEAQEILNKYFRTYSEIKRWLDKNGEECFRRRYSETLSGRRRFYELQRTDEDDRTWDAKKRAIIRMANNHVIQGTNADITKTALIDLQEYYTEIGCAKLLFTVHDEIVSEVEASRAEEVSARKAEIMKQAFHKYVKDVSVGPGDKVSVSINNHWSK